MKKRQKPPPPDELGLGELPVGSKKTQVFYLKNTSQDNIRFEFPETLPAPFPAPAAAGEDAVQKPANLVFAPSVGHVKAGGKKKITVTFQPGEKLKADNVSIPCKIQNIEYDEPAKEDWDDTIKVLVPVVEQANPDDPVLQEGEQPQTHEHDAPGGMPSLKTKQKEVVKPEPAHHVLEAEDATWEMPLKISCTADEHGFECETSVIHFAPTMMFCTKVYRFSVKNTSSIALPYEWKISGAGGRNFEVVPKTGSMPVEQSTEFTLRFHPTEIEDFRANLKLFTSTGIASQLSAGMSTMGYTSRTSSPYDISAMDGSEEQAPVEMHTITLNGSAVRPLCHFELPPSDYRDRREGVDHLDAKCMIIEFPPSLGTRVKNTKRFYVLNPTAEAYDFVWYENRKKQSMTAGGDGDENALAHGTDDGGDTSMFPFRCLTKHGHILSGKKFEMVFEYLPMSIGNHESQWTFQVVGKNVEQEFLVVGSVKEPRVGFKQPFINFGRLLLGGKSRETLRLVNKEHIPFSFQFDRTSYGHQPGESKSSAYAYDDGTSAKAPTIFIHPESGVVGPNASFPIEILFKPMIEETVSHNIICKVKRKQQPLALKVKGEGYKIHASLVLREGSSNDSGSGMATGASNTGAQDRILHPGVKEVVDFGSNLQVHEKRSFNLVLKNSGSFNFDYIWQILYQGKKISAKSHHGERHTQVLPPFISISSMQGVAPAEGEQEFTVEYAPLDTHSLDGCVLKLLIPSAKKAGPGPAVDESCFVVELTGRARRPQIDFSFTNYDFGHCFINKKATATVAGFEPPASTGSPKSGGSKFQAFKKIDLVVSNRDVADCLLSTTFQRSPYLDVQLNQSMIEAGQSLIVPIVFSPRDTVEYRERIEFIVNDFTKFYISVSGKGTPLKLELVSMDMQTVDFGVTVGNKPPVSRQIKLINRSRATAEFILVDQGERLRDRHVHWNTPMGGSSQTGQGKQGQRAIVLRPKEICPVEMFFNPAFRVAPFKYPLHVQCQVTGEMLHIATVCGECHATEIKLSEHSILFPAVVVGSKSFEKVHLHNFGDLGSKYKFEIPPRFADIFFIQPSTGYVAPHDDVILEVSFCPKVVIDRDYTCENIVCHLDNHEPVRLSITGRCIAQPANAIHTLNFETEVRKENKQSIQFPPSGAAGNTSQWKLQPEVRTVAPLNTQYFFCAPQVMVPPNGTTTLDITYKPLTMTKPDETKEDGTVLKDVHKGSLFIATPDGNAYVYQLEGIARPPTIDTRINVEVPCKTAHQQAIPVANWLNQRQRFEVKLSLQEPAEGSEDSNAVKMSGLDLFDLPPKLKREYKFSVYAYKQMSALVLAEFNNPSTGEFMRIEVAFKFVEPKSLAIIKFETACRQLAKWPIMVANPLSKAVQFKCTSTIPEIFFSPQGAEFTVQPGQEVYLDVCYRPVNEVRDGEGDVVLSCPELGAYPYKVHYTATGASQEKTLAFKAPLGSTVTETFRFLHFAKKAATYTAKIEAVPGQNANAVKWINEDFIVETKDIKAPEVTATSGPQEVKVDVKYQPSSLQEMRALLVLSSPDGGEYKAMLLGYAQPPQPQGPVIIGNKKPESVEFRNPFHENTEFTFQVDNPADFILKVANKNKIDPMKSLQVGIEFKGASKRGSRLIVTCEAMEQPWIFFLEGTAEETGSKK